MAFLRLVQQKAAAEPPAGGALPSGCCPSRCRFHRLAAPRFALVRASSCGQAPRDPTWSVVGHYSYRRRSSEEVDAPFHPPAILGLASNDSLKLTRRPRRPPGDPRSAWAALAA